jgi:hypothetical protein
MSADPPQCKWLDCGRHLEDLQKTGLRGASRDPAMVGEEWRFLCCIPVMVLEVWWCGEHPDAPDFCKVVWQTQPIRVKS